MGILSTFNYQFQYNALIVALFLLPFYELSERLYAFMHERFGDSMQMNGSSRAVMMLRWLIVRVDIFAIVRTSETSQSRLNSAPITRILRSSFTLRRRVCPNRGQH